MRREYESLLEMYAVPARNVEIIEEPEEEYIEYEEIAGEEYVGYQEREEIETYLL